MLPGLSGAIVGAGRGSLLATFTHYGNNTGALTTYTFSGAAIGAASADRYIVVEVTGTDTFASCTVGGAAMTNVVEVAIASRNAAIFITNAPFPSGTTADVVVTFTTGSNDCKIGVYALTGGTPAVQDTLTDTGTTLSGGIDVEAGGCIFAVVNEYSASDISFSGVTGDWGSGGTDEGGSFNATAAELNRTITATVTGANSADCMAVVSFRPN